jgi:diguanylate cyclase (GGDEF)-like protein
VAPRIVVVPVDQYVRPSHAIGAYLKPLNQPSNQPDLRILKSVQTVQTVCLIGAGLIAAGILCGWVMPGVVRILPHGWALMKANTALAFLIGAAGIGVTQSRTDGPRRTAAWLCSAVIMIIAGSALFAYSTGHPIGLETILGADSGAAIPGRMSVQTAVYLELVGFILMLESARRKFYLHLVDVLTIMLVLLVLTVAAGYTFDAADFFGQSEYTRVSPQTLGCMSLLGIALVCRRTRGGFFAVLVGHAIGSQTARVTLPFAVMLPFLVVGGSAYATRAHWLSTPYAAALAASLCSIMIFGFVVLMARRINDLERKLRDISLTDELTKIHNRRAFYVLGEYAMHEARRTHQQLTVLYFDLNGLKRINDSLGHEMGSRLLIDAANLLRANFRNSDIVARVGGDEFAIVARDGRKDLLAALIRLDAATAAANAVPGIPYRISYSMGEATHEPGSNESFVALVERADGMMYERKRHRAAAREAASSGDTHDDTAIGHSVTGVMAAYATQNELR